MPLAALLPAFYLMTEETLEGRAEELSRISSPMKGLLWVILVYEALDGFVVSIVIPIHRIAYV